MVSETKTLPTNAGSEMEAAESHVAETKVEAEVQKEEKKEGKVVPETLSFKTQSELDAHIEKESTRRANSIANKSTASYQKQMEELKAQVKQAEQRASEKQEDDALSRLEKKQQEIYGADEDLPDFQEAQKTLLLRARELKKRETIFNEREEKYSKKASENEGFVEYLKLYLAPEDSEEFLAGAKSFREKWVELRTEAEKHLFLALEQEKLERLAEATPNTRDAKPDSALGTAPGGVDITKLGARELLRRGFAKEFRR